MDRITFSIKPVGTVLTPNHGHAALMGAFGMEAVALMVLAFRQVSKDMQWAHTEKFIRVSFWGLNTGLALMIAGILFPGGILQFHDVLTHGYWHARGLDYLNQEFVKWIECDRCKTSTHLTINCMEVILCLWFLSLSHP